MFLTLTDLLDFSELKGASLLTNVDTTAIWIDGAVEINGVLQLDNPLNRHAVIWVPRTVAGDAKAQEQLIAAAQKAGITTLALYPAGNEDVPFYMTLLAAAEEAGMAVLGIPLQVDFQDMSAAVLGERHRRSAVMPRPWIIEGLLDGVLMY
ncbi:MAG: hypothetical protein ACOY9Y_09430 [Bacillota bacterium]